jgi:hypothetical protein
VFNLRGKYGRQSLRGYNPEDPEPDDEGDDDDDEARIVELDDSSEEARAAEKLNVDLITRWLDDRANDG